MGLAFQLQQCSLKAQRAITVTAEPSRLVAAGSATACCILCILCMLVHAVANSHRRIHACTSICYCIVHTVYAAVPILSAVVFQQASAPLLQLLYTPQASPGLTSVAHCPACCTTAAAAAAADTHINFIHRWWSYNARSEEEKGMMHHSLSKVAGEGKAAGWLLLKLCFSCGSCGVSKSHPITSALHSVWLPVCVSGVREHCRQQ
jgi:hypothetical protein